MRKSTKRLWTFGAAGFLFFLSGCSLLPEEEVLPTAPVLQKDDGSAYEIVEVVRGDLTLKESMILTYQAKEEVRAYLPDESLVVKSIYVTEGQEVVKGELLAEADNAALLQRIHETQWDYQQESLELSHQQETLTLWQEKLAILSEAAAADEAAYADSYQEAQEMVSKLQQTMELQKESVRIVSERLSELEEEYSTTQVRASIGGIVTSLNSSAAAGAWICMISDFSEAYFTGEVTQVLEVGETESVSVAGLSEPYRTTVVSCEDIGYGKYSVLLQLEEPDLSLRSGRSGSIERITEEAKDVLYLPESVLQKSDGSYYVYYLDENEIRRRKAVTVGSTINGMTVILEGVEEGEQLIR